MKPGAFLVNIARGGVVDEAALLRGARPGGHLRGAALDVHERRARAGSRPSRISPNVVLTPHIGAQTIDAQEEIGREIVAIIRPLRAAPRRGPIHASHDRTGSPTMSRATAKRRRLRDGLAGDARSSPWARTTR